jgi:hypothetical protein
VQDIEKEVVIEMFNPSKSKDRERRGGREGQKV